MAGAVQRLHGDGVAERIAGTQGLNIGLTVIGAVLPVTVGIDGQHAVIAVVAGAGKLLLSGVGITDAQGTRDGE